MAVDELGHPGDGELDREGKVARTEILRVHAQLRRVLAPFTGDLYATDGETRAVTGDLPDVTVTCDLPGGVATGTRVCSASRPAARPVIGPPPGYRSATVVVTRVSDHGGLPSRVAETGQPPLTSTSHPAREPRTARSTLVGHGRWVAQEVDLTGAGGLPFPDLLTRVWEAADVAVAVGDASLPDHPLVWVNPAFEALSGYSAAEVTGRNCRFLQGAASETDRVEAIRLALAERRPVTVRLTNYRKDGTPFLNEMVLAPLRDPDGTVVGYVAVMRDVTADDQRERLLREAHAEERAARQTQTLLAEATSLLTATLDVEEALDRLARLVVPLLADWAVLTLVGDDGNVRVAAVRHRDADQAALDEYAALQAVNLVPGSGQGRVLAAGRPLLIEGFPNLEDYAKQSGIDPRMVEMSYAFGLGSAMVVPLTARRHLLGTLALMVGPERTPYTQADLDVAVDLGRRAGLALDNARLYQRERRMAETLQRSLLPDVPEPEGVDVAVRYVPGDKAAEVGGDFYEVLDLPDGGVGLAVGDVVGHDVTAAAQMGHLRRLLQACAYDTAATDGTDPAKVLARVDRLMCGLHVAPLATLAYVHARRLDGAWRLDYASAGHPHVIVRLPDAGVTVLDHADGLLLGVAPELPRTSAACTVPAGSVLFCYTDGLLERRGEDIGESEQALLTWLGEQPVDITLDDLCDAALFRAGDKLDDDIAILAVRLT